MTILLHRLGLLTPALLCLPTIVFGQTNVGTTVADDSVELFVYAGRDATLVRRHFELALAEGSNLVEFCWKDLTIDPTSISLRFQREARVGGITFPAGRERVVQFTVDSDKAAIVKTQIAYMTTGFSAATRYRGVVSVDRQTLDLVGYIELKNNSPDNVENARVYVVAGDVPMIEDVAAMAGKRLALGQTRVPSPEERAREERRVPAAPRPPNPWELPALGGLPSPPERAPAPLQSPQTGAPEYWVYPADGIHRLGTGEARQFDFLVAEGIGIRSVVRFHPARFGNRPNRVLLLKNDTDSGLGQAPIPHGPMWLLIAGDDLPLPVSDAEMKQSPIGAEVELNMGPDPTLVAKRARMAYELSSLQYDPDGRISGYDAAEEYRVELRNSSGRPMDVEVLEEIAGVWDIRTGEAFTKKNDNTVVFHLLLEPGEKRALSYRITTRSGTRVRG